MEKCPNCGGIFPLKSFVCDYCGYVQTEKVRQINEQETEKISFDESIGVIEDNLKTLHEINKPSIKNGIIGVLRVIVAIHTFGIILIFWKKPKNRFNKKSYVSFKKIIERNIEYLKVSSEGSEDLLGRIKVIEKELVDTDIEIKKNLKAKRITAFLVAFGYISLIIVNSILNPILTRNVYPVDQKVCGDLKDTLGIELKACEMNYYSTGHLEHFKLKVNLMPLKKFELKDSLDLNITLQLTDKEGNPSDYFYPAELGPVHKNIVIEQLEKGPKNNVIVEFEINEKKEMKELPPEITNFIIETKLTPKDH